MPEVVIGIQTLSLIGVLNVIFLNSSWRNNFLKDLISFPPHLFRVLYKKADGTVDEEIWEKEEEEDEEVFFFILKAF